MTYNQTREYQCLLRVYYIGLCLYFHFDCYERLHKHGRHFLKSSTFVGSKMLCSPTIGSIVYFSLYFSTFGIICFVLTNCTRWSRTDWYYYYYILHPALQVCECVFQYCQCLFVATCSLPVQVLLESGGNFSFELFFI